jgi:hypothetical protein
MDNQTVDNSSKAVGYDTSLQLTPTGWPAISYYDVTNGDLKYTYKNTGGWHTEVVDSGGNVGMYSSLQLNSTGWPAISYFDETNQDLKYTYKSPTGWHPETADSGGYLLHTVGINTSLQLTPTGWPAISYEDQTSRDLKYAYKSAS